MHSNSHYFCQEAITKFEENKHCLEENTESEKVEEYEETRCVNVFKWNTEMISHCNCYRK